MFKTTQNSKFPVLLLEKLRWNVTGSQETQAKICWLNKQKSQSKERMFE